MDLDIIWNVFGYYLKGFHFGSRVTIVCPVFRELPIIYDSIYIKYMYLFYDEPTRQSAIRAWQKLRALQA